MERWLQRARRRDLAAEQRLQQPFGSAQLPEFDDGRLRGQQLLAVWRSRGLNLCFQLTRAKEESAYDPALSISESAADNGRRRTAPVCRPRCGDAGSLRGDPGCTVRRRAGGRRRLQAETQGSAALLAAEGGQAARPAGYARLPGKELPGRGRRALS